MFGVKRKKADENSSSVMQKSARGNMDEYEALRTIVAENPGILTRVMDKIRIQRTLSGKGSKPGAQASSESKDVPKDGPEERKPREKK
ncbi:MAG: hypothetical protein NTV34_12635 [Proteobacteria bacterium]|nr:hypothetical protein [Pseudomonadota bacterium]